MKIDIKYIAPYYPYGLKGIYTDTFGNEKIGTLDMIYKTDYGFDFCMDENAKPILHPLSDLTKEIEVNGERFVPIVEIGKILGYDNLKKYEVDGEFEYGWDENVCGDYQGYSFGWYEKGKCFAVWYDHKEGNPINTDCNLDAINKLFEWHFNVFNLPEDLWIDINTLK